MHKLISVAIAASALVMQASIAHADDAQCKANYTKSDSSFSSHEDVKGLSTKAALKLAYAHMIADGWAPQLNENMGLVTGTKSFTSTFSGDHPMQTLVVQAEPVGGATRITATTNKLGGMLFMKNKYAEIVCSALEAVGGNTQVATAK